MPKKKPTRGSGVSVTLPTEPLAGNAKTTPIMAVMVQDEGTPILEYEIKEGQSYPVPGWRHRQGVTWNGQVLRRTPTCSWTPTVATWSQ